jgi:hypothetical protein
MDNDAKTGTPQRPRFTKDPNEAGKPRIAWFWWIILAGLLVWNLFALWPKSQLEVTLPYTAFLDQVRTGNVVSVSITGAKITGEFIKPVTWPAPATSASSQANGPATDSTSYQAFTTNFPDTIGDTSLMPLLEAQHVQVDVSPSGTPDRKSVV